MNPGILASIAAIGVFCLTLGLSYPLLALILDSMGTGTALIGLNAAMTPLGIIVSSPLIPPLACRFGAWFMCVLLVWLIQGSILIWPMLFIWGAIAFGTYTVAMVELGARFSGALLLAGNSAFGLMWGLGGMVGPTIAGTAMDLMGPQGLPVTLGLIYCLLGFATRTVPLSRKRAYTNI